MHVCTYMTRSFSTFRFKDVHIIIRECGSTLYVGMTRGGNGGRKRVHWFTFMLKRRLKLSSKPHEAIEGLFYLVHD